MPFEAIWLSFILAYIKMYILSDRYAAFGHILVIQEVKSHYPPLNIIKRKTAHLRTISNIIKLC